MSRAMDDAPLPRLHPSAPVLNDPESGTSTPVASAVPRGKFTPPGTPRTAEEKRKAKKGGGRTAGDEDMPDMPKNNMWIVIPCLLLVLFLAALDMTIIATALPTIAEQFGTTPSQYSWMITSYQLSMTLLTPITGRVSDIVGRKPILYVAIVDFFIFSALCGASKSSAMLIIARAFAGLGGGAILGLINIIISDISPMEKRGTYQGMMGASWGIAAVLGPILGGVFTKRVSWRWCFYINLPIAGLAFILLIFFLKLNKPPSSTFAQLKKTFDFVGLGLVMVGASLFIVGFSFAADWGFNYKPAIALIVVGGVLFGVAVVNCLYTKRTAVIPARLFKTRTTLFFLIGSTLHAAAFIPCNILLPQFFQGVHGADALQSGIQLLPFAIFVSWSTVVAGQIQSRLRIVRPIPWFGYGLSALSAGLLYRYFNWDIKLSMQYGLLVLPAVGMGLSLQTPLLILQAAMPLKDVAAVTAAWTLTRSLGGSVGVSVMTAVLNTGLRHKFDEVEGDSGGVGVPTSAAGYQEIHKLPDGPMKRAILAAFADSFKPCWIIILVLMLMCLVITLPTRAYSLNRPRGAAAAAEQEEGAETESKAEHPRAGEMLLEERPSPTATLGEGEDVRRGDTK